MPENKLNDIKITANGCSIEDIINGMSDWVRVIDRDDNILYMNRAMSEGLNNPHQGEKCYKILGRSSPCENCTSREAVFKGKSCEKEETINDRIFSVMSSPVRNEHGEITSVVEVLRDVTTLRKMQKQLIIQNKRLQDDLKVAKKLQCSLLPKNLPENEISFSFIYKPCETLGGDFIDIFMIDDYNVGVYIADVSGHGVLASMLTVFLRSTLNKKILSPAKALSSLYKEFNAGNFDTDLYITIFYAVINLKSKKITYSNAGHNVPPLILNKNKFELLRVAGTPISNWVDEPEYIEKTSVLSSKDKIFICTDGIIELRGPNKEQFGEDRILQILQDETEEGNPLNRIFEAACSFAGIEDMTSVPDDITLGLLEIK